jgi:DNA-binding protein HU-beta
VTKADFIDKVASKSGLSKRDATKAVDAFLDSITDALRSGEAVPRTGEKVTIAAARVPKFSAGSSLKQAVKGG